MRFSNFLYVSAWCEMIREMERLVLTWILSVHTFRFLIVSSTRLSSVQNTRKKTKKYSGMESLKCD